MQKGTFDTLRHLLGGQCYFARPSAEAQHENRFWEPALGNRNEKLPSDLAGGGGHPSWAVGRTDSTIMTPAVKTETQKPSRLPHPSPCRKRFKTSHPSKPHRFLQLEDKQGPLSGKSTFPAALFSWHSHTIDSAQTTQHIPLIAAQREPRWLAFSQACGDYHCGDY